MANNLESEEENMTTTRTVLIAGLLILAWTVSSPGAETRKWTDSSGTFSVEAEFVELADAPLHGGMKQ
jgi:hypothetical protein